MMAAKTPLADQLHDIKPPVEIADGSLYLYWGLIVLGLIMVLVGLYWLYRTLRGMRRTHRRREYLAALKQIDWRDPKQSAYLATRYGRLILGDEERLDELYRQMVAELEAYKYRKEVDPLNSKTKTQFELFVKACDESL
jgi:ABC-type nickel/cobalt efflux system permease component RcnA